MPEGGRITEGGRPLFAHPAREAAIAELFAAQRTVATTAQLDELGLPPRSVRHRAAIGRLYRIYPTVYSTTPPALLYGRARWLASVLACGPGALLSHRSAAALHGIRGSDRKLIDVTTPARRGRALTGIDAHVCRTLTPADLDEIDGIACTSLARTTLDIAAVLVRRQLERAIDSSEVQLLFDRWAVDDVLARNPTHRGAPKLAAVLDDYQRAEERFSTLTESDLEEGFVALCDAAKFPRPETQVPMTLPNGDEIRVDFMWRKQRVIVETDGPKYHRTPFAREQNAQRDLMLCTMGWRPVRLTPRMVFDIPAETTRMFKALLESSRFPP